MSRIIITKTPFRLPLLAGCDFPDYIEDRGSAFIVTSTINKFLYLWIREAPIQIGSKSIIDTDKNLVQSVPKEYIEAVFSFYDIPFRSLEIAIFSDIPKHSGLAGSTALLMGLIQGVRRYLNLSDLSQMELAKTTYHIERNILGRPVGYQNPFPIAFGGGIMGIEFKSKNEMVQPIIEFIDISRQEWLRDNLLLFYIGRGDIQSSDNLKCDMRNNQDFEIMDQLNKLAHDVFDWLNSESQDLQFYGSCLNKAYELKLKCGAGATDDKFHKAWKISREAGAYGGKMCGSGRAMLLLCCKQDKQDEVRMALKDFAEIPFAFTSDSSKVIADLRQLPSAKADGLRKAGSQPA